MNVSVRQTIIRDTCHEAAFNRSWIGRNTMIHNNFIILAGSSMIGPRVATAHYSGLTLVQRPGVARTTVARAGRGLCAAQFSDE